MIGIKQVVTKNMLVPYIAIVFIILAFFVQDISGILQGFVDIQLDKSILLTDYVVVGGLGASLINSGLLMLGTYGIVRWLKLNMSGPIFAGILTIGGFAFFGKNIVNVSIIYLGVFLYAKYKQIPIRSVIVIFLFATGLAPISSLFMFGLGIKLLYSIPLGIFVGLFSGFVLVEMSAHVITFHRGYDLYNVGFAGGILSLLFFGIIKQSHLSYTTVSVYTNQYHWILLILITVLSFVFLVIGYILNDKSIKNYKTIVEKSGRAITDFTRNKQHGVTMMNVGLTGLLVIVFISIFQIKISGPIIGALMTVLGFSAFGKHPRNVLPGMIGVVLMAYIFGMDVTSIGIALAIIFSTGLAPLAGEHGFFAGLVTGMVHLPIALTFSDLHGGILLYSNGFAAAFTAVIVFAILSAIKREENKWRYTK